jgi:hypothetical protein
VLTHGNHPGKAGQNWGTGYMPIGTTAGSKAAIGMGIFSIVAGGETIILPVPRQSPRELFFVSLLVVVEKTKNVHSREMECVAKQT